MPNLDPRVDAYIESAAAFAQPILRHLRDVVHQACPAATETIKWGFPFFQFEGPLCHMAAFKSHVAFGFWKGRNVVGDDASDDAMGQFGRLQSIGQLLDRAVLIDLINTAVALKEKSAGQRRIVSPRAPRAEVDVPSDLVAALAGNAFAAAAFTAFPPSQRRDYVEWMEEAKRPETRAKRLAQAIEWIAEGKSRNWKYQR